MIAYIGNKRALLPFLHRVFTRLHHERAVQTFLDPFAGSGSVGRLARWMGFAVHANDWEYYAYILNRAFVTVDKRQADRLFAPEGGLGAVIGELNSLHGAPAPAYISRHYAPGSSRTADYRRERLFYTHENAEFIDRVRAAIEERYPADSGSLERELQRALLIAPLLYQAATHANTSGVFKAYHKGFGGHGADALRRILNPMQLQLPLLIDRERRCSASMRDAADCSGSYDLVYLDPPYNQHQYGSNYFMLNTIARWDCPPVDQQRLADGSLRAKAGIRADWVQTRSAYCSRRGAAAEFERLLDSLDTPRLVLSYNAQGIIELPQLIDICSRHGHVEIDATDYVRYRGGRQSLTRRSGNHEFVLIVQRQQRCRGRADIAGFLARRGIAELCGRVFAAARLPAPDGSGVASFEVAGRQFVLHFDALYRLSGHGLSEQLDNCDGVALQALLQQLQHAVCVDHAEEAELLLQQLGQAEESDNALSERAARAAVARLLRCLRKLAHRKYRTQFEALCGRARELALRQSERFSGLAGEIDSLEALARKRRAG